MVHGDQGGHGFDDGDRARENAGVVAAACTQRGSLTIGADGFLRLEDGCGRLEGNAEDDVFTVGDAALRATRAVRQGADPAALLNKEIVVLAPLEQRAGEAAAELEALGGG